MQVSRVVRCDVGGVYFIPAATSLRSTLRLEQEGLARTTSSSTSSTLHIYSHHVTPPPTLSIYFLFFFFFFLPSIHPIFPSNIHFVWGRFLFLALNVKKL
jgi:hypothetical protein